MPEELKIDLFQRNGIDVSRETFEKFVIYQKLLLKWQKAINLVGPLTLEEIPTRHFLDSAQVYKYMPSNNITLTDLGSGAGFPGLILAILGVERVHLIESDVRKATFLREVSRETSTPVVIHDRRVEDCHIDNIDMVTARALAPLKDLLAFVDRLRTENHPVQATFLKGGQYQDEMDKASKQWIFESSIHPSVTDAEARIIQIANLQKKSKG